MAVFARGRHNFHAASQPILLPSLDEIPGNLRVGMKGQLRNLLAAGICYDFKQVLWQLPA